MKSRFVVVAIAVVCFAPMVQAYFDPTIGRWANRDPIGEPGFQQVSKAVKGRTVRADANLYMFVHNQPVNKIDPLGLDVWVCTNPAFRWLPGTRHAYFWDDTGAGRSCSMQGSSGIGSRRGDPTSSEGDIGPGGDTGDLTTWDGPDGIRCRKVPDSHGREEDIFNCCQTEANRSPIYIPGALDCHMPVKWCLKLQHMHDPGHPRIEW